MGLVRISVLVIAALIGRVAALLIALILHIAVARIALASRGIPALGISALAVGILRIRRAAVTALFLNAGRRPAVRTDGRVVVNLLSTICTKHPLLLPSRPFRDLLQECRIPSGVSMTTAHSPVTDSIRVRIDSCGIATHPAVLDPDVQCRKMADPFPGIHSSL